MTLHAILASHNRRDVTVQCVRRLDEAAQIAGTDLTIVLFDDGSTDGTSEAVLSAFPQAVVIEGDGNAFWARGMSQSEAVAIEISQPGDYILWVNDDVALDPDALARLLSVAASHPDRVIVGSTRDPEVPTVITYAGFARAGWHPLRFSFVTPGAEPLEVDAFNGNLVAVPVQTIDQVGGIDGAYSHAFADIDFGMRLAMNGQRALLAPGTFGECARNPPRARSTLRRDWAYFRSPKGGGNIQTLKRYMRRHAPLVGLVAIPYTYIGWWLREISTRVRRETRNA